MPQQLPKPIRQFVLICVLLEFLALLGLVGGLGQGIRNLMVAVGGFWPSLLAGYPGGYPGQWIVMFATATLIHGGPLHLIMNMIGLAYFGQMVTERAGDRAFWPVAGLSALGSGIVFGLLATSPAPMVGASGILFGLLGTIGIWAVRDRLTLGASLRPLMGPAMAFIGFNVVMTLVVANVAWQAHLGGAIGGAVAGLVAWRPPRAAGARRP